MVYDSDLEKRGVFHELLCRVLDSQRETGAMAELIQSSIDAAPGLQKAWMDG